MSVVIRCCCDLSSDPPSSSSPSDSSPSDSSFSESPSLSDSFSVSSSSSSLSASSDSNPPFDFCACDCCLWPNKFILTVSDIQFINDAGFGGTQPGILNYPTQYTMERVGGLSWASSELVYDVADDISDGGFDFPTNIFGLSTLGTVGFEKLPGSRFVDRDNGGTTLHDRQAFIRFDTNRCAYSFSLFGVGQKLTFSQSTCFPVGTTDTISFLPINTGAHGWSCMGGATFGSFGPRITGISPFRTTCRLPAVWWMPFGLNAEMPVASLAVA